MHGSAICSWCPNLGNLMPQICDAGMCGQKGPSLQEFVRQSPILACWTHRPTCAGEIQLGPSHRPSGRSWPQTYKSLSTDNVLLAIPECLRSKCGICHQKTAYRILVHTLEAESLKLGWTWFPWKSMSMIGLLPACLSQQALWHHTHGGLWEWYSLIWSLRHGCDMSYGRAFSFVCERRNKHEPISQDLTDSHDPNSHQKNQILKTYRTSNVNWKIQTALGGSIRSHCLVLEVLSVPGLQHLVMLFLFCLESFHLVPVLKVWLNLKEWYWIRLWWNSSGRPFFWSTRKPMESGEHNLLQKSTTWAQSAPQAAYACQPHAAKNCEHPSSNSVSIFSPAQVWNPWCMPHVQAQCRDSCDDATENYIPTA